MARLDDRSSYETMLEFTAQVVAGLGALDELAGADAGFLALRGRIQAARDKRDGARWLHISKSARVRVFDARWDRGVTATSSAAFVASNSDAKQDPYNALFGTVKAADVVQLGPAKAEAFGNTLLARGAALALPALEPHLAAVKTAQALLMKADVERDQAATDALTHEVERRKLLKELEREAALAEVAILTRFPGDRALVNAILVADRPTKRAKQEESEEAPTA